MQCPSCRRDLAASAAFCGACGTRVRQVCGACSHPNALANAFCERCGEPLAGAGSDGRAAPPTAGAGEDAPDRAERRPLTVMFCDLVDSTQLAARLDAEDLREVIDAYLKLCAGAVEIHGGRVAQVLGDGVLVYFGHPQAHEDDPIRAVDAALEILASLPALNAELGEKLGPLPGQRLSARIGVHTGPVVVGDLGGEAHRERLALGDTVNLAARLQSVAQTDTVVISEATRALVQGAFVLEELGSRVLKGIPEPAPLIRVLSASGARDRLDRAPESELSPFVGRERELGMLLELWERVVAGQGRAAFLQGEPGVGKSRLLRVLRKRLERAPLFWLEGRCSSVHQNSAFYPVVGLLRRAMGFAPAESDAERVASLERWVEMGGLERNEGIALLTELLELPLPEGFEPQALSPDVQRKRTLDLLPRWLAGLARHRPVVLVIEDLHWVDPSTLELLETYLASQDEMPGILLVGTYRPEFRPRWGTAGHLELALAPLSREETAELAGNVARGKPLPPEILDQVVDKTDGVPLFVEELTRNVLESDLLVEEDGLYRRTHAAPELAIPSTLEGSLMARLDRLGRAREVAQLGAVVGREFSVELLAAVSPWPGPEMERALKQLERAGIVRRRGLGASAQCSFRHALIQDAAYQSQLRSQRRAAHARIAGVLEERFGELVDSEPEVVARHWEVAGHAWEASGYYQRAGQRAMARSAHPEAAAQLRKGIALLDSLDETPERRLRELSLQNMLGMALLAARGYGNPEVERACERARSLSRGIGDGTQLVQSLGGLFIFYLTRGDLETATELAEEYEALSERLGGDYYPQWAHLFTGMALHYRGHWKPALDHFEACIAAYDGSWSKPEGIIVETDQGIASRCMAGQALWMLGRPERGLARTQEALAIGRRSGDPNKLAFALVFSATMHQLCREPRRAREDASEVVGIAQEHRFPMWLGMGKVFRGWALSEEGAGEEGLAEIVEGTTLLSSTGARLTGPQILGLLGEVYAGLGRFEEAAHAVEAGLEIAGSHGLDFWNPELHRLRGEVLMQIDPAAEADAEACFRCSRELADAEGALSFSLRTACSAARLLCARGRGREAREWLAPLCERLREGQASRDLREATALLTGLGASEPST